MPMPWVKIYGDILDDVKMSRISDEQKWRYVQLILLASECDAGGALVINDSLMTLNDVSWRLRVDKKILKSDIDKLIEIGVVEMVEGAICVTKFMDRQGPTQEEKRGKWREYQERRREKAKAMKDVINDSLMTDDGVINESTLKNKNKIKDQDIDSLIVVVEEIPENSENRNIFKLYEDEFKMPVTQMVSEELKEIEREFPPDWIVEAFKICISQNVRKLSYLKGIMKNWKVNGFGSDPPGRKYGGNGSKPVERPIDKMIREENERAKGLSP